MALSPTSKVAWSPAWSPTSTRAITPSVLGMQAAPPVPELVVLLDVPEPVDSGAQVPSRLQIPEAQSDPIWQVGSSYAAHEVARTARSQGNRRSSMARWAQANGRAPARQQIFVHSNKRSQSGVVRGIAV